MDLRANSESRGFEGSGESLVSGYPSKPKYVLSAPWVSGYPLGPEFVVAGQVWEGNI